MTAQHTPGPKLFKTTIVIWSDDDPTGRYELEDMAYEATSGNMYCSGMSCIGVDDPSSDTDWDGTEFFAEPHE